MIFRRFLLVASFAALAGLLYPQLMAMVEGKGSGSRKGSGARPAPDGYTVSEFRRDFPAEAKAAREQAGLGALAKDSRLEKWLGSPDRMISSTNLDQVMVTAEIPGFKSLRATGVTGGSLREFSKMLRDALTDPASGTDNRMGFLVRDLPDSGYEVILLTGEALPELTLAGLNSGISDSFISQCPHCRKQSTLLCEKSNCGFSVDCPECGLRCRVLAQDTNGQYREATTFLLPSACPEVAPGTSELDTMLALWQTAVRRCQYVEDFKPGEPPADLWQTPGQTLRRGAGDCEDSALLLTDWLIARGIPARMAMGKMEGDGHAWCIARIEDTDYLLESTNRNPDMNNLPVVKPGDGYVPSTLIDREALYVRAHPSQAFDGDYWSPGKWIKLPRAKSAAKSTAVQSRAKPLK